MVAGASHRRPEGMPQHAKEAIKKHTEEAARLETAGLLSYVEGDRLADAVELSGKEYRCLLTSD